MSGNFSRRNFLKTAAITASAALLYECGQKPSGESPSPKDALHLGVMTYTLARDWDIETIIKNLTETNFECVELRTTHTHGVEVDLTSAQRAEVKKRFADSPIRLSGLASGFYYHSPDPDELRKNIEDTKEYVKLAQDVGAVGIRVFPNMLLEDKGIPKEKTIAQIGRSLREVGEFAEDYNVKIKLCAHGRGTSNIPVIKSIMDAAEHDNVVVNWNCNPSDLEDGGFDENFEMIKDKIFSLHMHELSNIEYPYRKLFKKLLENGFNGDCFAEIDASREPIRLMNYYRALFLAYQALV